MQYKLHLKLKNMEIQVKFLNPITMIFSEFERKDNSTRL